jgi:hypothetical protein
MDQYVGRLCVHLVPECSEHYRDQCKDLKQQMHTEHTNYIADFHLLHNGPVNLQTGTRSRTAHLSVVVTTSRSKYDSSKLMTQLCLDESRSRPQLTTKNYA